MADDTNTSQRAIRSFRHVLTPQKPRLFFSEYAQEEPDSFLTAKPGRERDFLYLVHALALAWNMIINRISHVLYTAPSSDSSLGRLTSQRKTEESLLDGPLITISKLTGKATEEHRIASPRMTIAFAKKAEGLTMRSLKTTEQKGQPR